MNNEQPVLGKGLLAADRLAHANINPATGLATDYLNHFNEVVMLLEMLPAMPECAEDVLDWSPVPYEAHFETSTFKDKELAVMAYRAAPQKLRTHLEARVAAINSAVESAQQQIREAPDVSIAASDICEMAIQLIRPLISQASGIIHGYTAPDPSQAEGEDAQAEIDAMFA